MAESNISGNYWAFGAKGWGVAATGIACFWFWQGPVYSGSNFWFTALNQMFGWSVTSMAMPIALAGILSIFGVMLFGALAKKIGAKRVIVICLVLAALSNMIFAAFLTLWSFGVSIILFFFFSMGYSVIGVSQLGADWFPRTKGVYMGVVTVGQTANMGSINLILAFLVPAVGITASLSIYSGIQLIIAVLVGIFIKNTPEEAGACPDNDKSVSREELIKEFKAMEEYKRNSPWTVKALLACPTMWKIAVAWGLCMSIGVGIMQQLVQLLVSFGHPVMLGITLITVGCPICILGHLFIGVLDLRFGTRNTSILMALTMTLGLLCVVLFGGSVGGAVLGVGLLMIGITGITNVTMSMTATSFGRKDFENAWPIISTIFQLIANAGVLVIASLAAAISYRLSLVALMAVLVIGAGVMFTTPKAQVAAPPKIGKAATAK